MFGGNLQTLACPQADPTTLPAICNHYSQLKTAFACTPLDSTGPMYP